MPRREDIEKFAQVLNSLGSEPQIRASKAETIEEVAPPEEGLPADISEFLAAPQEEGAGVEEALGDLSGLLEDEQPAGEGADRAAVPEEPVPEEPVPAEGPPGGENLDFASLFGEEAETPSIEDLERSPRQKKEKEKKGRRAEKPAPSPEIEPPPPLQDIQEMEALPEDFGEAAPPAEAAEAPPIGEEPSAEPFGSFEDLGETEPSTAEAPPEESAETAQPEAEGIELPNLEDLTFAEPGQAPGFEEPGPAPAAPPPKPGAEEIPPIEGFDLGGEEAAGAEVPPAAEPSLDEALPPAMESLGEESLGDLDLDEFSIPESAEQFGVPEAKPEPKREPRRAAPAAPRKRPPRPPREEAEELAGAAVEVALTPEQFARVKKTLEELPRNLKIAVQEAIASGTAAGAGLTKLVGLLVAGAAAQEIAALTGRITGTRIRIPAGYEKKTGVAFEEERRTFAYAFRENILPLVRLFVIVALAGAILGFFGWNYVVKPVAASLNYRRGYASILQDRYAQANERFSTATGWWLMKRWYFRYAEGFADRRQYVLAEEKYDELLKLYPRDRKATLEYARMESTKLANYKKADDLLQDILDKKMYDYDALIAAGDNDIEWASIDAGRYEVARVAYASLIERYGATDELLFRMLRFFIRTDNGEEVERLRAYYGGRLNVRVNPEVFAELGGYLVDRRRLDFAQDVLLRAAAVTPDLPEIHYNLARYYRLLGSQANEKTALGATIGFLKATDALTTKRLAIEIDTHTRLGELFYSQKEYLAAEKDLTRAISLVEANRKNRLIGNDPLFGRPYAVLGDILYYIEGDLASAKAEYQKAEANRYKGPGLSFKIGYTQYASGNSRAAIDSFLAAENAWTYPSTEESSAPAFAPAAVAHAEPGQLPANLLYALGNSFYLRGDYFAAQGYYLRLLDRLSTRKAAIGTLSPRDQPEHRSLLENLVKVNNNLGVVMLRLSERTGDRKRRTQALVYLAGASEISDSLSRDSQTLVKSEAKSLPVLNTRGILYPVSGFEPQIYVAIPKDFQALFY